jgi:hypothetical protein
VLCQTVVSQDLWISSIGNDNTPWGQYQPLIQPKMNGDISVQTIHTGNNNVRKIRVAFIVYGREVKQHTAFWYLRGRSKRKEHLGQLDVIDWLRVRRFGVQTPVVEIFFPPI